MTRHVWQRWRSTWLLSMLVLAGCMHRVPPPQALVAHPHYVLGRPYQIDGYWFYPAEDTSLDVTGLASVQARMPPGLTATGELRDPSALTAAMQTIQLPVVVTVTNLENGLQTQVRVNDRGPASPGRMISLSPRAAFLLQVPANGAARVRVQIDGELSRRLAEQLGGGQLAIATAPRGAITVQALPPPGVSTPGASMMIGNTQSDAVQATVPNRLPEVLRRVYVNPGQLWLRVGEFGRFDYANMMAAKLAGLGGDVLRSNEGRQTRYAVRAGPFRSVAEADAALSRALGVGLIDARITVE